jgi:hypothetical protein
LSNTERNGGESNCSRALRAASSILRLLEGREGLAGLCQARKPAQRHGAATERLLFG